VNTGAWENDYGGKLFNQLERGSNALGISALERDKFIQKEAFPIFDGTQEYCLWLGCMGGYDPKGREIIASFVEVMRYLGTSYGVLRKEKCTGDPARRLGNDLVFQQLAESNLETMQTQKVKKIVSICPHCVRTIQTDWKEFGAPPEIEHHSEFLARHQAQLPHNKTDEKIVYHDPCYLGRYRNIYDEPRSVIESAGTLVEPERTRERSFCCGAGGGLAFLGEESGPFCNTMFRDALASSGESTPQLLDIAQLAARTLPQS
jgi:Fe-S oxidoreductase